MDTEIPQKEPPDQEGATAVNWTNIILFVVLAFGISWAIWLGLGALGVIFTVRASIGMFGPALAATLVRRLRYEGFADAGLRLQARGQRGVFRYYAIAYLFVPIVIAAGIVLALLTTYQHWAFGDYLHYASQAITKSLRPSGSHLPPGYTPDSLAVLSIVVSAVLAFSLAIPFNMIFTFGEEFGWRGYLLPKLAALGGIPATLITGVVWGLWHAPLIVLESYNYPGHPWPGVLMMVVFTVSLGTVLAWLRFRTTSIWPGALAHAAFNAQAGFAIIFLSSGDSLLRPPIGLIGLVPLIAFAAWLAITGRLKPRQVPSTEATVSTISTSN